MISSFKFLSNRYKTISNFNYIYKYIFVLPVTKSNDEYENKTQLENMQ